MSDLIRLCMNEQIPNIFKTIGHHRPERKLYNDVQSLGYTPLKEGYQASKLGRIDNWWLPC